MGLKEKTALLSVLRHIIAFLCILLVFLNPAPCKAENDNGDVIVYVTDSGACYHRDGCTYLKSKHAISLEDADRSYQRCSRCDPPILGKAREDDAAPYLSGWDGNNFGSTVSNEEKTTIEYSEVKENDDSELLFYSKLIIPALLIILLFFAVKHYIERKEQIKLHEARCRGELPGGVPGMPFGTIIGGDGLPRQIDAKYAWGPLYTFYISRKGTVFHRNPRCGNGKLEMIHALYIGKRRPCKNCCPTKPSLSWFMPYFNQNAGNKELPLESVDGSFTDYWIQVQVGTDLGGNPIFERINGKDPQELGQKIKERNVQL